MRTNLTTAMTAMVIAVAVTSQHAYALRAAVAPQPRDGGVIEWSKADGFVVLGAGNTIPGGIESARLALAPIMPVISWNVEKVSDIPPPPVFQRATVGAVFPAGRETGNIRPSIGAQFQVLR